MAICYAARAFGALLVVSRQSRLGTTSRAVRKNWYCAAFLRRGASGCLSNVVGASRQQAQAGDVRAWMVALGRLRFQELRGEHGVGFLFFAFFILASLQHSTGSIDMPCRRPDMVGVGAVLHLVCQVLVDRSVPAPDRARAALWVPISPSPAAEPGLYNQGRSHVEDCPQKFHNHL